MTVIRIVSGGKSYDLDIQGGRLYREHDELIPLSKKQWDLLNFLVINPNRLISKEELIEKVWKRAAVTDEAVAQTIRALRKALDDDLRTPVFIENEYGRGYRFIAELEQTTKTASSPPPTPEQPVASEQWFDDPKWLVDRLMHSSPDPHDGMYIAPMLLAAKRLGKRHKLGDAFFNSLNALIKDIDDVRKNVTYPAPAHISVHDLEIVIEELEGLGTQS